MTYLTYLEENYVTGRSATSTACCVTHCIVPNPEEQKKNTLMNSNISKEITTFGVPHQFTYYAKTDSVLQFNNFLQDKAGGAVKSVGWCGNFPNPGCIIISPLRKSYQP